MATLKDIVKLREESESETDSDVDDWITAKRLRELKKKTDQTSKPLEKSRPKRKTIPRKLNKFSDNFEDLLKSFESTEKKKQPPEKKRKIQRSSGNKRKKLESKEYLKGNFADVQVEEEEEVQNVCVETWAPETSEDNDLLLSEFL